VGPPGPPSRPGFTALFPFTAKMHRNSQKKITEIHKKSHGKSMISILGNRLFPFTAKNMENSQKENHRKSQKIEITRPIDANSESLH
jgi:hypothetical protein